MGIVLWIAVGTITLLPIVRDFNSDCNEGGRDMGMGTGRVQWLVVASGNEIRVCKIMQCVK